jgi:hypothetical protein
MCLPSSAVFLFAGLTALLPIVSGARAVVWGDNVVWSEILGGIF